MIPTLGRVVAPRTPLQFMNLTDRLSEIEKRANAATKGPWRFIMRYKHKGDTGAMIGAVAPGHQIVYDAPGGSYPSNDGEFIAHAREDVPFLIAELRRLQDKIEDMRHEARNADERRE